MVIAMKLPLPWGIKPPILSTRALITGGLLAALVYALQVAMAGLPNIEPVSLLVILYTLSFPALTPYILAVFIVLEGFTFGFGIWWVNYLYIWPLLAIGAHLLRRSDSALLWAVYSGAFGLGFGALCAIPWAITGGIAAGFAYWISGIPFDIAHCIGNFVLMLALYRPLSACFTRLCNGMRTP